MIRKTGGTLLGFLLGLVLALGVTVGTARVAYAATGYPLWVGGTQVTPSNASDVFGDGKVSYDDGTKTLSLNGYSYSGKGHEDAAIYAEQDLTIELTGVNTVTSTDSDHYGVCAIDRVSGCSLTITGSGTLTATGTGGCEGIYVFGNVTVNGGTVTANGKGNHGIYANGNITASGGTVNANSNNYGIYAKGNITVDDGTVTANGNNYGIYAKDGVTIDGGTVIANGEGEHGIYSNNDVTINGGTVNATGKYSGIVSSGNGSSGDVTINGGSVTATGNTLYGIFASKNVTIGKEVDSVVASGADQGIGGTVKNAIAGTGWTDTAGTEDKADIAESEGQKLTYRKVKFPAEVAVTGVTLDKSTATLTVGGMQTLTATVQPDDATDQTVKWSSSDESVATVDENGKVTAMAAGTATITVTTTDGGKTATCTVTVKAPAAKTHTVTFDANGHGTAPAKQTVEDGDTATKPADPTADGYTFGGWYTDKACTKEYDFSSAVTSDLTLYAKWTEEADSDPVTHTVTFDANGHGTAPAKQTVEDGKKATKPANPTATGWTFGGWFTDESCTKAYDFSAAVTSDLTLYAKWTKSATPARATYAIKSVSGTTGDSHTWTKGSGTAVVITATRSGDEDTSFDHFTGVSIDGKELAKDTDYTVRKGSTVVTLKAATLQALSAGEHTVKLAFDDGSVSTKLTVKEAASPKRTATPTTGAAAKAATPKTGDASLPAVLAGALALAGAVAVVAARRLRREQ